MPYAAKVQTLIFDEGTGTWVNDKQVVITKNSVAGATEPASALGKTAIRLNDGSTLRVNQTVDQILSFLNDP